MTREPILKKNVLSAQPLHGRLRGLDFYIKLITHLKAGQNPNDKHFWSESKKSADLNTIKEAKHSMQKYLKEMPGGIRLDIPDGVGCGGTTTTGNVARRLMNNDRHGSRDHLLNNVPEHYKEYVSSLLIRHGVILNVFNSKKQVKQLDEFKTYCHNVYSDLLTWFPHAHITPTVHKILAHSWEIIHMNNGFGLGMYSEEGLEGCNKFLRRIRISLSRKVGKVENQSDCIKRLWSRSDPVSNKHRLDILPLCTLCNIQGHSTRYCPLKKDVNDAEVYASFFTT